MRNASNPCVGGAWPSDPCPEGIGLTDPTDNSVLHWQEMVYLKEKVDAGSHFVITQMFLDAQVFLDFVDECRKYDIKVRL